MSNYFYRKGIVNFRKKIGRVIGILVLISGLIITSYIFFPLISWQLYFSSAFAQNLETPIPKPEVLNSNSWGSLMSEAGNVISGIDYTKAQNWFPEHSSSIDEKPKVSFYNISIPKLKIQNAIVSTQDLNLTNHLVNFPGTAIPSEKGTAVIFGHSTLPQLFNPSDYKTIFAKVYLLKTGDIINTNVNGANYTYKIYDISIVSPDDTSIFTQDLNDSYITLVTCTPPGTTWKRLIIKSRIEQI